MIRCNFFVMSALFAALFAGDEPARGADIAEIQTLLKHEIVGADLPMTEVQWYCDERVPAMPDVRTVDQWEQESARMRATVLERIVYRGEAAQWRDAPMKVEWLDTIEGGPGYRIRKLRYEALPGLWIPALLYEPENISGKVPAVLNVNGHTSLGKQYPPKQLRCINQAKRGMLALNIEWVGMGQLSGPGFDHYRMNQLDLCGTSGLAPFYLDMKRGLDVLLSLEHADPDRVAVTGLSGGGWQTIFISSLDTRVKLTNPVAGHSSFKTRVLHLKDLGDSEQMPNDLATICDYTHLTAMMAPRPTLLTFNLHDDCCFEGAYALEPLVNAAKPIFQLYGKEQSLRSHINDDPPAKHNYEVDNRQQLYRMLGDFFHAGDEKFDAREIPSDDEVKSEEALRVAMPEENQDFNKLALSLCKNLPRDASLPTDATNAIAWQQSRRVQLREIVRAKDYEVAASQDGQEEKGGVKATFWKLRMSGVWTVPVVELVQGEPQRTAILVADDGRQSAAAKAAELLSAGYRVIAVDPFYLGESKIAQRDFLFALLVAAVGDRPIGLQASQVAAVARWATALYATDSVTLIALGPRSSAMALIAGALEDKAIGSIAMCGSLGSLKQVIEQNWGVNEKPELFCFGLLESFDIKQLAALITPRPVTFVEPDERTKTELADLAAWYRLWQSDFDPLAADLDRTKTPDGQRR
jgi:dienelactone hydrolase